MTEPEPARGVAVTVAPGIRRVVAANPSPMTYHGTNSFLAEQPDGLAVIDPGPDLPAHVDALVRAGEGRIRRILVTHTHADHVGAAATLAARTGAPVLGWRAETTGALADGQPVGPSGHALVALHTPGHASDHLCFRFGDILFSGDHVMGWSTSVVWPPDGDMGDYMASLRRLLGEPECQYLPAHGPAIAKPHRLMRAMLAHRQAREQSLSAFLTEQPRDVPALRVALYPGLDPALCVAAERMLLAHLLDLERRGEAAQGEAGWRRAAGRASGVNRESRPTP